MFDFTVRERSGFWVLQDAGMRRAGAYETHDEAWPPPATGCG